MKSMQCMCIDLFLSYIVIRLVQREKLLGLAGEPPKSTTKKRANKKSDESITPIRYNVIHVYW